MNSAPAAVPTSHLHTSLRHTDASPTSVSGRAGWPCVHEVTLGEMASPRGLRVCEVLGWWTRRGPLSPLPKEVKSPPRLLPTPSLVLNGICRVY